MFCFHECAKSIYHTNFKGGAFKTSILITPQKDTFIHFFLYSLELGIKEKRCIIMSTLTYTFYILGILSHGEIKLFCQGCFNVHYRRKCVKLGKYRSDPGKCLSKHLRLLWIRSPHFSILIISCVVSVKYTP